MIKQYFFLTASWVIGVVLFGLLLSLGGCTTYHVEQNANNGATCKKGLGNYSIFGNHECSIGEKSKESESKVKKSE